MGCAGGEEEMGREIAFVMLEHCGEAVEDLDESGITTIRDMLLTGCSDSSRKVVASAVHAASSVIGGNPTISFYNCS